MVKEKTLKVTIGLDVALSLTPFLCGSFWLFMAALYVISGLVRNVWSGWRMLPIIAAVMFGLWFVTFIVALVACKRRIILDGFALRITDKGKTVYECPIGEIIDVGRGRFSPILEFRLGTVIITNHLHPLPDNGEFLVGWFAYKKIKKAVQKKNNGN